MPVNVKTCAPILFVPNGPYIFGQGGAYVFIFLFMLGVYRALTIQIMGPCHRSTWYAGDGSSSHPHLLLAIRPCLVFSSRGRVQDVARRVMDAGAGLGLSGLPTGNISSGDIRDAVADLVSDTSSFRSSAGVLSGVLRWENNIQ